MADWGDDPIAAHTSGLAAVRAACGVAGLAGLAEATDGTEVTFALLLNGDQSTQAFGIWTSLLTTLLAYPDLTGLAELGPLPPTGG